MTTLGAQRQSRTSAAALSAAFLLFVAFHVFDCGNLNDDHYVPPVVWRAS